VGYWAPVDIPQPDRLVCAFSSRQGGISEGSFASLNLGLHVGDQLDRVLANRARFSQVLGMDLSHWITAEQVHGCHVAVVGREQRGLGAFSQDTAISRTDGLVTRDEGVWLVCHYADCVPLVFWDMRGRAVGVAHAGWRGTLASIGLATVEVMARHLGSEPKDLYVLIGPAIGVCCYSVGEDVAAVFRERFDGEFLCQYGDRVHLDLRAVNRELLIKGGIPPDQILVSRLCTACQPDLCFSHRRDKSPTGRMVGIVGLRER